jgi:hypothetical protein
MSVMGEDLWKSDQSQIWNEKGKVTFDRENGSSEISKGTISGREIV